MVKVHVIVFLICSVLSISFSATASSASNEEVKLEVFNWKAFKLSDFIHLTSSDLIKITGRKMSLLDKISFSMTKHSMKKALKKNANLTVLEYYSEKKSKQIGAVGLFLIIFFGFLLILILIYVIVWANSRMH